MSRNTCGNCRYFKADNRDGGDCHANPPVIVEAMIDKDHVDPLNAIMLASWYPNVGRDDIACRFFVLKGAAA